MPLATILYEPSAFTRVSNIYFNRFILLVHAFLELPAVAGAMCPRPPSTCRKVPASRGLASAAADVDDHGEVGSCATRVPSQFAGSTWQGVRHDWEGPLGMVLISDHHKGAIWVEPKLESSRHHR
jgi:hypothetical protein